MKKTITIFLIFALSSFNLAHGMSIQFISLEWLVDSSQAIFLATGISREDRKSPSFERFKISHSFKGTPIPTKQLYQYLSNSIFYLSKPSEFHLIFLENNNLDSVSIKCCVDLNRLSFPFACVIDMKSNVHFQKDQICKIIENRVKLNRIPKVYSFGSNNRLMGYLKVLFRSPNRSYILEGAHWLKIPADPEFRNDLLKNAKTEPRSQYKIFPLLNYPDNEVKKLLHGFLDDNETYYYFSGDRKVFYFPIRQAAYDTLILMGESIPKPEGWSSFIFGCYGL